MITCICFNVSDKKIKEICEKNKIIHFFELKKHISCGKQCGKCVPELKDIIKNNSKKIIP